MLERGLDKKYKFVLDFKPTINKTYGPFKMIRFIYRLASSDVIFTGRLLSGKFYKTGLRSEC